MTRKELIRKAIAEAPRKLAHKTASLKLADACGGYAHAKTGEEGKASPAEQEAGAIRKTVIINTTNLYDSHEDVHIDGIWDADLAKNAGNVMFLQEHRRSFDALIAQGKDVQAYVLNTTFEALGITGLKGSTQALTFDAVIRELENPAMYSRYKEGRASQHSVGMRYTDVRFAADDENNKDAYALYKMYYDRIANKEDVPGYFYPVLGARVFEGSAVLRGSNFATPVLELGEPAPEPQDTAGLKRFYFNHR